MAEATGGTTPEVEETPQEGGTIRKIFEVLTEGGSRRESFGIGGLEEWLKEDRTLRGEDVESLKKVCLELLDESKRNKGIMDKLISDGIEMKQKIRDLEIEAEAAKEQVTRLKGNLGRQEAVLENILGRMEDNKKALESSVKKTEESVNKKYNEVVKMSREIEEDRNERSRMSSKVEEVITTKLGHPYLTLLLL